MHIGLITYQTGHQKTIQLAENFLKRNYRVTLFAVPFKLRVPDTTKYQPYQDRPHQLVDIDMQKFCESRGACWHEVQGWDDKYSGELAGANPEDKPDVYVTCIGKIIPKSFIEGRNILNCHPGLLPENRGVDAFKWSIVNKWPIGVTLHIIDEEIDRGTILQKVRVPVYADDKLRDVCQRAYEIEIDLASNLDKYIANKDKNIFVGDDFSCSHKRIPMHLDENIEDIFLANREQFIKLSVE